MDLRQLKSFVAVVEEGTLMRAAERLDYAQSTITLHLQELEAALGTELFERRGRRLYLTEAGQTFNQKAVQVLRQVESLQVAMQDFVSGDSGEVRFAAIEPTLSTRLPGVIAAYCEVRPRVRLVIESGSTSAICQRVSCGELDFGLCGAPDADSNVVFEPLLIEELVLLLPEEHPLAKSDSLTIDDLAGQRLLFTSPSCVYRRTLERTLLERGVGPDCQIEVSEVETLKQLVRCGTGLAVVPRASVLTPPDGTTVVPLEGASLHLTIGIVQRPDAFSQSRAVTLMLEAIREHLAALRV